MAVLLLVRTTDPRRLFHAPHARSSPFSARRSPKARGVPPARAAAQGRGKSLLLPASILQARPCRPAPGPEDLRSGQPARDEGAEAMSTTDRFQPGTSVEEERRRERGAE